ncbi:MAG: WGR domain-containing protein [Prochlorothrix sp.]
MADLFCYLEFFDPSQNSHKFYEVTVVGSTLTVRYGRVSTVGSTQVKTYASAAAAQADAQKKIREKQRKGYQEVQNSPSPASPNPVPSALTAKSPAAKTSRTKTPRKPSPSPTPPPQPAVAPAPVAPPEPLERLWCFEVGGSAFGLAIEVEHCWVGTEKGLVFKLNHQGQVLQQFKLPDAIKCLVIDDIWVYAGCDNGSVYDLTGKMPYLAYEVEKGLDIFALAIQDGTLGVSDANGGLTVVDSEGETLWDRLSPGKLGWMLCADSQGFYHGHSKGVTGYELGSGCPCWQQVTQGKVLFGCQGGQGPDDRLYVATSGKKIQVLSKNGDLLQSYDCGASVYACTTDSTGDRVFAADSSAFLYGFDCQGTLLWKQATGCGSIQSLQYFQEHLYGVTNLGGLVCFRLAAATVAPGRSSLPATATSASPTPVATALETIRQPAQGVVLDCVREGQKLRIRPLSAGYHRHWHVQFPRDLRQEGDRYWVSELREANQGGFYRPYGEIKRLVEDH